VARGTLDEIMTGRATYQGVEIFPDVDETILAVETRRSWGCAFDFAFYSNGGYAAEAMFAVRTGNGEWQDLTDSGVWGDGWGATAPWAVPDERWPDGDLLWVMGRVGMEGDDDGEHSSPCTALRLGPFTRFESRFDTCHGLSRRLRAEHSSRWRRDETP